MTETSMNGAPVPPPSGFTLVIEDEPVILKKFADYLSKHGHKILTADGPIEAIERVEANMANIRTIVIDIMMPDENEFSQSPKEKDNVKEGRRTGILLIKRLREMFEKRKKPFPNIIALTGYDEAADLKSLQDQGVTVLKKPLRPEDLAQELDETR